MSDPDRLPKRYGLTVGAYALEFKHEEGAWPIELTLRVKGRKQKQEVIRKRRTIAQLINPATDTMSGPAETVVAEGEAYCSPSDGYDFEVGRQTAIFDLLRSLPKEHGKNKVHLGRQVMAAYLTRPRALPWALDRQGKLRPWVLADARVARREGDAMARIHVLSEIVAEALVEQGSATPA